jgi:hypothetical protein
MKGLGFTGLRTRLDRFRTALEPGLRFTRAPLTVEPGAALAFLARKGEAWNDI